VKSLAISTIAVLAGGAVALYHDAVSWRWLLAWLGSVAIQAGTNLINVSYNYKAGLGTPGYAAAESTFFREFQAMRDEVQKLQQQLDSAVQAFDQASIALSPAAKDVKRRELQQLQDRITQRSSELDARARSRNQELLAPYQARINTIIQGIRAEGNYAIIFDADAQGNGIVAADPMLNLTSKVIERVRRSNP